MRRLAILAVLAIAAAIAIDFALFVLREMADREPEPEWGAADPRLWEVRAAA